MICFDRRLPSMQLGLLQIVSSLPFFYLDVLELISTVDMPCRVAWMVTYGEKVLLLVKNETC
jgi:hypothetical protein